MLIARRNVDPKFIFCSFWNVQRPLIFRIWNGSIEVVVSIVPDTPSRCRPCSGKRFARIIIRDHGFCRIKCRFLHRLLLQKLLQCLTDLAAPTPGVFRCMRMWRLIKGGLNCHAEFCTLFLEPCLRYAVRTCAPDPFVCRIIGQLVHACIRIFNLIQDCGKSVDRCRHSCLQYRIRQMIAQSRRNGARRMEVNIGRQRLSLRQFFVG